MRETSLDYENPRRRAPVRLFNWVGRRLPLGGPLTVDALVDSARRKAGLGDFTNEDFRTPLEVLLDSIEHEARLNPLGRAITRGRLVNVLVNRLRIAALLREHPEIEQETLPRPIVVVGLQRSGTTFLQRLLAAHPEARALLCWEALNPAPRSKPSDGRPDPRIREAARGERGLAYLAPDFFAVHPVEAEAPEEEVLLLDYSFLSTVAEATMHVPTYSRWLESQDNRPAYEYMTTLLKVLQWSRPGGRHWVLKTPHHLEYLDELLHVLPDATVVQTHRDPAVTLASFCSMIAHGRGVFSDAVDPREIGRHWSRKVHRLITRAMASRDRIGESAFVDVDYDALVEDPLAQVQRVHAHRGDVLAPQSRASIDAHRVSAHAHRYGKHRYEAARFGLEPERLEEMFRPYRERFLSGG